MNRVRPFCSHLDNHWFYRLCIGRKLSTFPEDQVVTRRHVFIAALHSKTSALKQNQLVKRNKCQRECKQFIFTMKDGNIKDLVSVPSDPTTSSSGTENGGS